MSTCKPLSDEDIEALRQDRGTAYSIRNDRLLATLDAKDREWNAHEASCMKAVMDECDEVKAERNRLWKDLRWIAEKPWFEGSEWIRPRDVARAALLPQKDADAPRCSECQRTWGSIEAGHGHGANCPNMGAPPRLIDPQKEIVHNGRYWPLPEGAGPGEQTTERQSPS